MPLSNASIEDILLDLAIVKVFSTVDVETGFLHVDEFLHCLDVQVVSITFLGKHNNGGISTMVAPGPGKSKVCPFNPL